MADEKLLVDILGNSGKDAEEVDTKIGPKVSFSVAVPQKFGDDGITRWVDVAVFDERRKDDRDGELSAWQRAVLRLVKKGSKVGVKGTLTRNERDGKTFYNMIAKQVFLLNPIARDGKTAAVKKAEVAEDEDLGW